MSSDLPMPGGPIPPAARPPLQRSILVIGPHPDDQELGMGGTIAALHRQGHRITIVDLSDGCPTPIGDRATRLTEAENAAAALCAGSGSIPRILLDMPNRQIEHTIENRHKVAAVIRAVQADTIFLPHPEDAHPDHLAATRIIEDARFDAKLTKLELAPPPGFREIGPPLYPKSLIYYYCSHLKTIPQPTFLFDISGHTQTKRAAILAYSTQFIQNPRNAHVPEWIAAQDGYFGSRIGTAAAEAFWMREPLGLMGLSGWAG